MVTTNILYCGDCKDILKDFPKECIDLIYIDPPFFSNRPYEIIWHNGAEKRAFEDRWKGGIQHYIKWMAERLIECYKVLKKDGLIYLHCDWHASHYLKIEMDKIFGENNFRNEIVWCYGGGGMPKNDFGRKHDIIFRYSKSDKYIYRSQYKPYSEGTLKTPRHSLTSGGKLLDIERGTPITDWWADLKDLTSYSKEWLGYPTQKPEALLQRIIETSSNKGDVVLDPMNGGGTTTAVAHQLSRRWVGIDVSPTACKVASKRMKKLGATPIIQGLPKSIEQLKKLPHFEFQNWVCEQLKGKMEKRKSGDFGIDGYILGIIPLQVKQQENVGRNPIDNFGWAIQRRGRKKGVFVAFSFGKGAWEEVARTKNEQDIEIVLLTMDDILKPDFDPMKLFK